MKSGSLTGNFPTLCWADDIWNQRFRRQSSGVF